MRLLQMSWNATFTDCVQQGQEIKWNGGWAPEIAFVIVHERCNVMVIIKVLKIVLVIINIVPTWLQWSPDLEN